MRRSRICSKSRSRRTSGVILEAEELIGAPPLTRKRGAERLERLKFFVAAPIAEENRFRRKKRHCFGTQEKAKERRKCARTAGTPSDKNQNAMCVNSWLESLAISRRQECSRKARGSASRKNPAFYAAPSNNAS